MRHVFHFHRTPRRSRLAFTLIELMIATAIFAVGASIFFYSFRATLVLMTKNTALNVGNISMQQSYDRLLTTLGSAVYLVDCANYNGGTQSFTAVSAGSWGNSVRFMRLLPVIGFVLPQDGNTYSVTNPQPASRSVKLPTTSQTIKLSYNTALYSASSITTNARLYPAFPFLKQTVSGGTSPGVKPGLTFDSVSVSSGVITLHLPTVLGTNTFLDCNRAFFLIESAFVVTSSASDGHKELIYMADTSQPSSFVTICDKLDGAAQTQANDGSIPNGGTAGTFCMAVGDDSVQMLLPVRSPSYPALGALGGAARNNSWIRVNTKLHLRQTL